MRIVVYSGSFDPIHTGHAIVAQYVSQFADVDALWLMVSRMNPLKVGSSPLPDGERLALARKVAERCPKVEVSDFELHLPFPSYSYHTLSRLKETYPQHDFVLLVGSDNWQVFDRWRNHDEIIRDFGLIIYPRPGYPIDAGSLPENVVFLKDAPQVEMSSTFIRKAAKEGYDINFFVPW